MALPLEGKVAVVTDSSRGVGKVLALRRAREGAGTAMCAGGQTRGEPLGLTARDLVSTQSSGGAQ